MSAVRRAAAPSTTVVLRKASSELGEFVTYAAATTSALVGFRWLGRSDAPSTFPDLLRAFDQSLVTGEPLPVSNQNTNKVIYPCPEVNLMLRYWHDVSHVLRGRDFTPPQELMLAQLQLEALTIAGYNPDSVVWRLLHADLVGQVYLSAVGRRFPRDQAAFVRRAVNDSVEAAVLAELDDLVGGRRQLRLLPACVF